MKKLYLLFLMLLIMFIPVTHSIAVYQLDQPINELNNYTLREVFQQGNVLSNSNPINSINGYSSINPARDSLTYESNTIKVTALTSDLNLGLKINHGTQIINNKYYFNIEISSNKTKNIRLQWPTGNLILLGQNNTYIYTATMNSTNEILLYMPVNWNPGQYFILNRWSIVNLTLLGLENLTKQQLDNYYNLYLEAVRFELENQEAREDEGGYQNIFKSILDGVKNLMQEMGNVWNFLNAPIITNDMQNYQPPAIDWSWDIIGVVRQIINNANTLAFQLLFVIPSLIYSLLGIPIHISLLSLLFSNLIFLLLGWIVVKSFII